MWQDKKNSQLKIFLLPYTVLLVYSKVKASQSFHCGTTPVTPSKNWTKAIYSSDQKNFSCLSYLFDSEKSQEKSCLPNCFTINIELVTEEKLSLTTFFSEWTFRLLQKACLFQLIFSVSSPSSLTTMRFPHSSFMNTSLGQSSKFPMSSISKQSSSSSTTTFFSEELLFLMKA